MEKSEVIDAIRENRHLISEFEVKSLYIFGSVVHGTAKADSDVDMLVEFGPDARIGFFRFIRLQKVLSKILNCPVDLATPDSLHKQMKKQIMEEAVRAA